MFNVYVEAAGGSGDFDDAGQQLRSTATHNKLYACVWATRNMETSAKILYWSNCG